MAAALGVALSLAPACSPFDPGLLPPEDDTVAVGCTDGSNAPPARPPESSASDAGTDVPDFWVALRDVLLDQGDNQWADIGYNIDNRCTDASNAATTTECIPVEGRAHEVDGTRGIDNSFGHNLFPLLDLAFEGLDLTAIAAELRGLGNPLLRVRGWNGTLNDNRVQIILTQSVFGTPSNEGAPPDVFVIGSAAFLDAEGTIPAPEPIWDGTDYFWGRDDTFAVPAAAPDLDAATALVVDNNAYVANGLLVATIPDGAEILLVGDGLGTSVRLSGTVATFSIGALKLDGAASTTVTIAGRWGYTDLLRTAESVGVCPSSPTYRTLQTQVTAMQDVLLDPRPDNQGTLCDAVSLGITFEAYPANIGGLALGQDLPNACAMMTP
jgi:hypothetical protein